MPKSVALCIQEILTSLLVDCCYPRAVFDAFKGESERDRWQNSVKIIYRLLVCGLIFPAHKKYASDPSEETGIKASNAIYLSYSSRLAVVNPLSVDLNDYVVWQEWDLCISEAGKAVIINNSACSAERISCAGFEKEIMEIFSRNGVPWGKRVDGLFPRD